MKLYSKLLLKLYHHIYTSHILSHCMNFKILTVIYEHDKLTFRHKGLIKIQLD